MYMGGSASTAPTVVNAILAANEFSGAVYIRGSFYSDNLTDDNIQGLQRKYHVFITGTNDPAKGKVRSDYKACQENGIADVKLIFDTKRIDAMPRPDQMDEALRFLDSRLHR